MSLGDRNENQKLPIGHNPFPPSPMRSFGWRGKSKLPLTDPSLIARKTSCFHGAAILTGMLISCPPNRGHVRVFKGLHFGALKLADRLENCGGKVVGRMDGVGGR